MTLKPQTEYCNLIGAARLLVASTILGISMTSNYLHVEAEVGLCPTTTIPQVSFSCFTRDAAWPVAQTQLSSEK